MKTENSEQSIGHYDIERVIGRGSMGMVYLARDRRIGRTVALKRVLDNPEPEFQRRLQREAEVCGALQHRNLVMLYEAGYEGERISYLAMEFVDGETLQAHIKRVRPSHLPVPTAIRIATDILRGLEYAHSKGIVHRDIKPANILINTEGVAKIADFGIARPERSSMTLAGAVMGTPNYMSPEQVDAKPATTKADIFSSGVILYEMLTGSRPFMGENIDEILKRIVSWTPAKVREINPEVPEHISELVERMLAKNPEDRPSASEALNTLTAKSDVARASARAPIFKRRVSTRTFIATTTLAILALTIPIVILSRANEEKPTAELTAAQLQEFEDKRRALAEADMLRANGRHEEAIAKYDAYLEKYPHSIAAESGRAESQAALDAQPKPEEVTPVATKKRPPKKLSPLERLRKFINR